MLYELLEAFNAYLPAKPLEAQLARLKQHEDQMYFAWIGKFGDKDPYYYRIHSPVTFCEFDFHCGSEYGRMGAAVMSKIVKTMLTLCACPLPPQPLQSSSPTHVQPSVTSTLSIDSPT